MIKKIALAVAALAFSTAASAGVFTSTVDQFQYVGWGGSHTYQHDLLSEGFNPNAETAISGDISISIYDDSCRGFLCNIDEILPEVVLVTIQEFDFDTGGLSFFATGFSGDLEVKALAQINTEGLLDVTISSILGDFVVGKSVLNITTVPEPGTLALLGLGLMGLGAARRRAAA